MPRQRRKNRRPAAKCKKKPQKPARPRSSSRSYSYSRSRSYSGSEGSSDGHSDEDDPKDYKRGGYHPVTPYQLYNARYRVLSKLGAGAFSTVWLCADEKDPGTGLVAMKVCKSKKSVAEQAQDEVMLLERMHLNGKSSPFVVQMTDHFWHTGPNGRHKCMTFEVMGENLLALVKHYDYQGIPLDMCRRISRHTLRGLEYIHACGVIHTDVKLENVLICRHDLAELLKEARIAHLAFQGQKAKLECLSKSQKKRLKKKNKKAAAADAKASDAEDKPEDPSPEVPENGVPGKPSVNGKPNEGYGQDTEVPEIAQPVPPVRQRERFESLKLEETFAKLADFGNGIKEGEMLSAEEAWSLRCLLLRPGFEQMPMHVPIGGLGQQVPMQPLSQQQQQLLQQHLLNQKNQQHLQTLLLQQALGQSQQAQPQQAQLPNLLTGRIDPAALPLKVDRIFCYTLYFSCRARGEWSVCLEQASLFAFRVPGRVSGVSQASYYEREGPGLLGFDRPWQPWQEFSEEERRSRGPFKFGNKEQASDYVLALKYLERWESEPQAAGEVLDLGCGDALMARRFAQSEHFKRVYALDILWPPLAAARAKAEAEKTGPQDGLWLLRGDAQSLPFQEAQLDFVWWGLGIHKVENAEEALRNIRLALRPGGRMIATTRTFLYPPFELRTMANAAGLANVTVECVAKGTSAERLLLRAERAM
ncbi:unnamed protein product [Effrenium voratum]|nr:unnamed protein product [Effrenium voratum]